MKRWFVSIMLIWTMILGVGFPAFAAQGGQNMIDIVDGTTQKKQRVHVVNLKIDGKDAVGDVPAILHQDRTLVPIRLVVEKLGAEVYWDQRTYEVTIQTEDKKIVLKINSNQASINGKTVPLPDGVPPKLFGYQGSYRTMVPLRFVSETLGFQVNWLASTRTVTVDFPHSSTPESPPPVQAVQIKGIDYDVSEKASKVFIKMTGEADVTPLYLQGSKHGGSDRLVLDIANSEFDENIGNDKLFEKAVYKGGIMKIRGSLFQAEPKKITRIVIDLDSPKEYIVEFDKASNTICAQFLNSVTDVRVEKRYNTDAVVIHSKEPPVYNIMNLGNRIVIDILNAKLEFSKNQVSVSKGGVSKVRVAPFTPDSNYDQDDKIVRVVLDLDSGKTVEDFLVEQEGSDILVYLSGKPLKSFNYQKKAFNRSTATLSLDKSAKYDVEFDKNAAELIVHVPKDAVKLERNVLEIHDNIIQFVRIRDLNQEGEYEITFKLADGTDYNVETKSSRSDQIVIRFDNEALEESRYEGRLVVIDAGHGGKASGAVNSELQLMEKDITLDTAKKLERLLKDAGFKTYMTRNEDVDVGLADRANAANNLGADVFISIHYNSHTNPQIDGVEVLYDGNDVTRDNKTFAKIVQEELIKELNTPDRGIKNRPDVAVLRRTKMPAILAELAFISNPEEAALASTDSYRQKCAQALSNGIKRYFDEVLLGY